MLFVFCTLSHGALHICKVFHNKFSKFQLTEQTRVHGRNGYVQCSKGNDSNSRQTRVKTRAVFNEKTYVSPQLPLTDRKFIHTNCSSSLLYIFIRFHENGFQAIERI